MTRWALALAAVCLVGCAGPARPWAPLVAPKASVVYARSQGMSKQLEPLVTRGFHQIFNTYDRQPKDAQLSFLEFGKVVIWEWFDEHDANDDDLLVMGEWLTPGEMQRQVAGIVFTGQDLVKRADRNADGALNLDEYLAHKAFEVDPTPWLAAPADPQVKRSYFLRNADAQGLLKAEAAAMMAGHLLADGYYLDDAEARGPSPWPHPVARP